MPKAFIKNVLTERGESGSEWLTELPQKVDSYCNKWELKLDGSPMHGYLGIVFPVLRNTTSYMLKLTWVDDETKHEALALSLWNGNGYVGLIDSAPADGALLLEALDADRCLNDVPIDEAVAIAGELLSRHRIPAPDYLSTTSSYALRQEQDIKARWEDKTRPIDQRYIEAAQAAASELSKSSDNYLINQDLHYENVLSAKREKWLVIDPKPMAGDIEFGIAPLLWNRCENSTSSDLTHRFSTIVQSNRLDFDKARNWSILRCVDYWLWSLNIGFDIDPLNCNKILDALLLP